MKKIFSMYSGLRKEMYVLAFGRTMTSMGALIWPMLTLILKSKLGMDASLIGIYMMLMSLVMLPCNLLGGRLADHFNKKKIIVFFDLFSVVCFFICGLLPLSIGVILIYGVGSIFQQMEQPSYDALVADITTYEDREKAYSLSYLSMNLGLVLAPMIGGVLFNDYLNLAFMINGFAILSSTILIYFYVKNIEKDENSFVNTYEDSENGNLVDVLKKRKILLFYFVLASISGIIYSQFNFLIPLHLEASFHEQGALLFGMLTSVNASVVILGTPIFTKIFLKWKDIDRLYLGSFLEIVSLAMFIFIQREFWLCVIAMIFFTIGEITTTISSSPYLTKRIPDTHRGRILSIQSITVMLIGSLANMGVGKLVDLFDIHLVWVFILLLGVLYLICFWFYRRWDRKKYFLLYN